MSHASSDPAAADEIALAIAEMGLPPEIGPTRDALADAIVARLLDERAQLLQAMKAAGVSIRELAARLGISPAAVSRHLGKERDMLIGTSVMLAHGLDMRWRSILEPAVQAGAGNYRAATLGTGRLIVAEQRPPAETANPTASQFISGKPGTGGPIINAPVPVFVSTTP